MDLLRDFEYTCFLCNKKLTVYSARQCSHCGVGEPDDLYYCIVCSSCRTPFCKSHNSCWDVHLPPHPKLALAHQMVDPLSQLFVDVIIHAEGNSDKQKEMHQRDEQARWFNLRRDHTLGRPDLYVYDRFIQLCDPSRSGNQATKRHYPSFVSFVGDTSVGKSTLVRAMLLMGIANTPRFLLSEKGRLSSHNDEVLTELVTAMGIRAKDVPVTRSGNLNHLTDPTTLGVHLYGDSGIDMGPGEFGDPSVPAPDAQYPILFADCEGFGAGEAMTNAERMESDTLVMRGREIEGPRNRSPSRRRDLALHLPVTANCYGSLGKDGVDLFYARFLYAISDVIVFVTKEDQRIQTELIRVLEWASKAVHKSVNHPSRKTLIIVRNMPTFHRPELYEVEKLRKLYLYSHAKFLWEDSPILSEFVNDYNSKPETISRYDLRINTNEGLYKALFNKITCCYIPNEDKVKGKPQELYQQYRVLRDMIESSVRDGLTLRAESVMQYNVPALAHILTRAFEHFTTFEKPFDFYLASRRDNPNPQSMQDHVANFLRHAFECESDVETINQMIYEVTSTALLIYTYRFYEGLSPADIFDKELYDICNCSIDIYIKEYEKCSFRFRDGQHCTSRPAKPHQQHTSAKGQFQPGPFENEREWSSMHKRDWIREIRKMFSNSYEKIFIAKSNTDQSTSLEGRLASEREICHSSYYNIWKNLKSNKTCLSCLQAVPDHVLGCGHSYCPRCVQELGHPSLSSECAWDMRCWLCGESRGQVSYSIQLKPRCAGVRILSLDGGGIRGIVELSVLQALHDAVGLELLPMKDMFDLIVGTSTGGIIALALAMSDTSIPEMMDFFSDVSTKTFSQTTAGLISKFSPLKKVTTYGLMALRLTESVFASEALKIGLKKFFEKEETSLFAPALHSQPSTTRVAVTSAKDLGQTACLITSYNHPFGNPVSNLEREEDSEKDMKIWEAGLATSAAPFYLPPFEKKETRTQYVDGAVYANCPAQVAHSEIEKLWPDNGACLDLLISLGTGIQKAKDIEIPTVVNLGFFASIRAMFQRQLDSKSFWNTFFQQTAPANVRSRLYRLDPPLHGEHCELYDYKRIPELMSYTEEWARVDAPALIQEVADNLIANLFFFEPNEVETTNPLISSKSNLSGPLYDTLAGSIRCRLQHGSLQLRKLLDEVVEGFFYAQIGSDKVEDVRRVHNWSEVRHPQGHTRPINMMVSEAQQVDRVVQKFRLPFTFQVKKQNNMFQVLAVKLKRTKDKIAISGFPSTVADLERRSKLKWLQ